jgi:CDP-paratose synthetase
MKTNQSKKICITGATGFIGRNLIKNLSDEGRNEISIIIRDDKLIVDLINPDHISYFVDNGNTEDLIAFFLEKKINVVIHLATLYLKDHHPKDIKSLIDSNITFGSRILEAAVKSEVQIFINTGTTWQFYDGNSSNATNLYAATKNAFHEIAKYYVAISELYFVNLILNDTYGANDTRKKIFNLWKNLKDDETLNMSPGEQLFDALHVDDVVNAVKMLLNQISNDNEKKYLLKNFSISNQQKMSLKEVASLFQKIASKNINIVWGATAYREREIMRPWMDGEQIIGWEPKISIEDGIKRMLENN